MSERSDSSQPVSAQPGQGNQGGGRRTAVLAAVSVAVVAVLGGGAWAAGYLLGGHGPQPEDVLPAATVAELSVDMDPSATQKVEALRTLRKFPALRQKLDLGADDDLRKWVYDQAVKDTACSRVDFATDVEPWLGNRAAVAAVDLAGKTPAPAVALQVSDAQQAKAGIQRLVDCGHPKDFGYAFADGYVVFSDSGDHARTIVTAGKAASLADDPGYTRWTGAVGDRGVLSFYVAKRAGRLIVDNLHQLTGEQVSATQTDALARQADKFEGLAGTVRFAGGGVELAAVGGTSSPAGGSGGVGGAVGRLPGDTALAVSQTVPDDLASRLVQQLSSVSGEPAGRLTAEVETMTGLRLPQDLQTLLGRTITVSLGGDAPDLGAVRGPADIPVAATVSGDTGRIEGVIGKLEERQGVTLDQLGVVEEARDGRVALATSRSYADSVLAPGDLGRTQAFREVVPEADRAASVAYVDFDSTWVPALIRLAGDSGAVSADQLGKARANLAPLRAFGASSWRDGDTTHLLVKLTTD